MELNIIKQYYTNNPCLRAGATCKKIGIQVHSIGTAQSSASILYNSMNRMDYMAGVHYLIDSQNGDVIQTMPENIRSWCDGGYGNDYLISIEICESNYMEYTGGASYKILDAARFKEDIALGYQQAVKLCADICTRYGWNPESTLPSGLKLISSHDEGRRAGLSTAHVDPTHLWKNTSFNMDTFRREVYNLVKGIAANQVPDTSVYYKVQCGAYSEEENAEMLKEKLIKAGFVDAFVKRIGSYYKVQIGAFTIPDNAEKLLKRIKTEGFQGFVTKVAVQGDYKAWVGRVTADKLNVRIGASADYANLEEWPLLSKGNLVDIIGESGDWYQVKIAGQHKGWVSKQYIQKA